jgi:RNA polymerase sigma factor (sigma-70 family)
MLQEHDAARADLDAMILSAMPMARAIARSHSAYRSKEDREDAVADAYEALCRAANTFNPELATTFKTFSNVVVKRHLVRQSTKNIERAFRCGDGDPDEFASADPSVEDTVVRMSVVDAVYAALLELTDEERRLVSSAIFRRHVLEAQRLGLTKQALSLRFKQLVKRKLRPAIDAVAA